MLEILKFIFSNFWIWAGTFFLLMMVCCVFCSFVAFLAEAMRSKPPPPKPLVPRNDN